MLFGKGGELFVDVFEEQRDEEKVMLVLSEACRDGRAGRAVDKRCDRRFCSRSIKIKLMDVPGSSSDFS